MTTAGQNGTTICLILYGCWKLCSKMFWLSQISRQSALCVPSHLLEEIKNQREKLEASLFHNDYIRRQLENTVSSLRRSQVFFFFYKTELHFQGIFLLNPTNFRRKIYKKNPPIYYENSRNIGPWRTLYLTDSKFNCTLIFYCFLVLYNNQSISIKLLWT